MNTSVSPKKSLRLIAYLVGVLFVLVPFHATLTVWLGSNFHHYTAFRLWNELLLGVASTLTLLVIFYHRVFQLRDKWSRWLWIFSIGYVLLHMCISVYGLWYHNVNLVALGDGIILNLRLLVVFWLGVTITAYSNFLNRYWKQLLLWPAAIVIVFGLLQHFVLPLDFLKHFGYGPHTILPYETVDQKSAYGRVMSTLRGANPLGAYLVVVVCALAVVWIKDKKQRLLISITGIAALIVLFFTYSRSAWLGTIVSIAILSWLSLQKKARVVLLVLTGVVTVLGLVTTLMLRHNSHFENIFFHTDQFSHSSTSSNQSHLSSLKDGIVDIVYHPLGSGPGTAGPASVHNSLPPRIAENYYIQIGQEVGVIGVVIFSGINIGIAWLLWRQRNNELALMLFASLFGISLINLFLHAWTDDTLAFLWWGLAGVAVSPAILKAKVSTHETQKTKKETTI